ncbi:hypothetical protein [Aquibacillus albus]|uniref:Lipoprotein n=1 Tax=Aquibacillus albus TaxID=1168171 RepID=A0ABS2N2T8_9BACI|nr:hypothetical protein [Aquibacillus albus]MBM7572378.1 hypothetical protein [Aquibacillus albus]
MVKKKGCIIFIILCIISLAACSKENVNNYVWKADSSNWELETNFDNLTTHYNKKLFTITLTYKGTFDEFNKMRRVQVHQGNVQYTASELFLDTSLKNDIPNDNSKYEFIDFSSKENKTLKAKFQYDTDMEKPFEEYITDNGNMDLTISWGTDKDKAEYTDKIKLDASGN